VQPINPQNLPICINKTSLSINNPNINTGWYFITLYPTQQQFYRVWNIVITLKILENITLNNFTLTFLFLGSVSYKIDWEVFPITGYMSIGDVIYPLNGSSIKVVGQNYISSKSIEFQFTNNNGFSFQKSELSQINMYIYDNPGQTHID
jgi:hypothetical protein